MTKVVLDKTGIALLSPTAVSDRACSTQESHELFHAVQQLGRGQLDADTLLKTAFAVYLQRAQAPHPPFAPPHPADAHPAHKTCCSAAAAERAARAQVEELRDAHRAAVAAERDARADGGARARGAPPRALPPPGDGAAPGAAGR
jgi:hypothetical protein